MPAFRYVAIDPAGQTRRGVMEAATEAEVDFPAAAPGQHPDAGRAGRGRDRAAVRAGDRPPRHDPAGRDQFHARARRDAGRRAGSRPQPALPGRDGAEPARAGHGGGAAPHRAGRRRAGQGAGRASRQLLAALCRPGPRRRGGRHAGADAGAPGRAAGARAQPGGHGEVGADLSGAAAGDGDRLDRHAADAGAAAIRAAVRAERRRAAGTDAGADHAGQSRLELRGLRAACC